VRSLVISFYIALQSVLKDKPHLRPCLTRCRHCRIFFLTHPRNRGRNDIGCPFGCRKAHRQKCSTKRSTEYNRTEAGKKKKKVRNDKRGKNKPPSESLKEPDAKEEIDARKFDKGVVEHVRMVTSLIEGREVSREEVLEMLERTLRQHSMGRERRIDYILRTLKENPP
jgi:hypothetical protein